MSGGAFSLARRRIGKPGPLGNGPRGRNHMIVI